MRFLRTQVFPVLYALFLILFMFLAALAPMMFTVGVISTVDRCGAYYGMLDRLKTYGKTAAATISYVEESGGYAGVDFYNAAGEERYGTLDLRYYSAPVRAGLQPQGQVQIRYIDALISGYEKVVLVDYQSDVERYICITPDLWGILAITWLLVMICPQTVFIGFVDGKTLVDEAFNILPKTVRK
jgi:hypothetical protein